jgi:hypothetical protein
LGSKVINYLYLGNDLLMDSFLGSVLHWEDWKLNPEWKPRLLFWTELPFDGVKRMHVEDKWFRPLIQQTKLFGTIFGEEYAFNRERNRDRSNINNS